MKDWNYWKMKFITSKLDHCYEIINSLNNPEANVSPLEKIAVLQVLRTAEFIGVIHCEVQREYRFKNYSADIVLYYKPTDLKIAIECDGHEFHEKTKQQVIKDKKRDREFQKSGFVVLRYSGSEIVNNPVQIRFDLLDTILPKWREEYERSLPNEQGNIRESHMEKHS